uniref:FZ domain-containing protein n=1 Tax=Coccolithus braarudii TaxID=221442 RepID=A0A7S0L1I1_9EUKA|mmetsp:Transcript_12610/g.27227  ORF Transcript_12610/g.27227 Transcript_12610/m.27227 type:complete len:276 (+) Transcript_12610:116-943(+)
MKATLPLALFVLGELGEARAYSTAKAHRRLGDDGHHHSGGLACGCEAKETDHPFLIDCNDGARIATAETRLQACDATDAACSAVNAEGVMECQQAFFILQAHHDNCEHDTLSKAQEKMIHDYEDHCLNCVVPRQYVPSHPKCPTVNCDDLSPAILGFEALNSTCVAHGLPGATCCTTVAQQGGFEIIYSYHEQCPHDVVPGYIEQGLHDYEHDCEAYLCNNVDEAFNPNECPTSEEEWQRLATAAGWINCHKAATSMARRSRRLRVSAGVNDDDE